MNIILRCFGVALLAAVLVGCGASHGGDAGAAAFQLRMYQVPAAQSKTIADKLDGILASPDFLVGTKSHTTMRATTPFPGAVLVLAPAAVQPSIATAVAELAKVAGSAQPVKAARQPESVPLRVQFWLVQAKAGAGGDAAALQPLAGALTALRKQLGPSHFALEDAVGLQVNAPTDQDVTAGNGKLTSARGHEFQFRARVLDGGDVTLDLEYHNTTRDAADRSIPELQSTVAVAPGAYVVLAQAPPAATPAGTPDATLMNLLVVRVDQVAVAKQ
jgi:hypothetical protein